MNDIWNAVMSNELVSTLNATNHKMVGWFVGVTQRHFQNKYAILMIIKVNCVAYCHKAAIISNTRLSSQTEWQY